MSDSIDISSSANRLGLCEVCARTSAKYTCPECEVKTCSLPCVKVHKMELDCSGIRSRVKFKRLNRFSNLDILNDYRLLEETGRVVDAAKRMNFKLFNGQRSFVAERNKAQNLIFGARRKEVGLKLLPPTFAEHVKNTTRYNRRANEFLWKVKWIFRQADDCEFIEQGISDSTLLKDGLMKYLDSSNCSDSRMREKMSPYFNREVHTLEVILSAQGLPGNKFFLLNANETISENLKYKNIIEHPVFHVILEEKLSDYSIVHIVVKNQNLLECTDEDADETNKPSIVQP